MIKGKVVIDKRTKDLVKRIKPDEIAVINHRDLDRVAGQSLVESKVKAIINTTRTISGRYPNRGPKILTEAGIPIIDNCQGDLFDKLKDGDEIIIEKGLIYKNNRLIGQGFPLKSKDIEDKMREAQTNIKYELNKFIENTLNYARQEKDLILNLSVPEIETTFDNRHALVVVRGADYKEDLQAVEAYIREMKPVIIAVDGGADACLERGFKPDIIIGDMDSVSDRALNSGSELIVHAYPDGRAPGLDRINKMGLDATLFPAPGTSEDIALLLAYEKKADLIAAVGTHSNLIDFLEKGRPGMSSTLLVRLKIGDKLVDARGVSRLYHSRLYYHYWLQVGLAILIPLISVTFLSPILSQLIQLMALKLRLIFSF
ncbi:putative cytokinetic ring protein SteA [Halothermothrix orenii]|uniref:Thiamin pyrophosphokinase catalytic region n=1 Tax=Halothermothrix orenii (strain H 168 / OCM 544 / DSM 9562) TaxID=373903 RepID=B8D2J0_HALOH|nr:putative cytokinetic ring protein SteA [Halothermothrix orenii]ACL69417.1 Thiamin pyrophosphokinase catalytic region [Halothermothrix orenii H 168]